MSVATLSTPQAQNNRAGAAAVQSGLENILGQVTSLGAAIDAFDGSVVQALNVHTITVSLDYTIKSVTNDVNTTSVITEAEGNAILVVSRKLVRGIQHAVTGLISHKAVVAGLVLPLMPAKDLALQSLNMLKQDATTIILAILAKSPASLLSEAQEQAKLVNDALNSAIAAYSS